MSYCRLGKDSDFYAWDDIDGTVGLWGAGVLETIRFEHATAAIWMTLQRADGKLVPPWVEEEILEDARKMGIDGSRIDEIAKRCTALTSYLAECKGRDEAPDPDRYRELTEALYEMAPESMRPTHLQETSDA